MKQTQKQNKSPQQKKNKQNETNNTFPGCHFNLTLLYISPEHQGIMFPYIIIGTMPHCTLFSAH